MNQYANLLSYIKTLAEEDSNVNHVIEGDITEVDLDKMIIPPIVNVNIVSSSFTNGNTVNFTVELACLQQRDINKEIRIDDFLEQDNQVDNLTETHAILNRIWLKMYKDFQKNNITSSENATLEKLKYQTAKILDGWVLTFDVEMPNNTLSLCP